MDLIPMDQATFFWALLSLLGGCIVFLLRVVWWFAREALRKWESSLKESHHDLKGSIDKLEQTLSAHFREIGQLDRRLTTLETRCEERLGGGSGD